MSDHAIKRLLSARQLEERKATDEEVVGFWGKALRAYDDARLKSTSLENRYERAYTAARLAAVTVLREAGYRPRGGAGHHYTVFYAGQNLVSDRSLADAFVEANAMRQVRHAIEYDFEDAVAPTDVEAALELVEGLLAATADHLRRSRPGVRDRIGMPK